MASYSELLGSSSGSIAEEIELSRAWAEQEEGRRTRRAEGLVGLALRSDYLIMRAAGVAAVVVRANVAGTIEKFQERINRRTDV